MRICTSSGTYLIANKCQNVVKINIKYNIAPGSSHPEHNLVLLGLIYLHAGQPINADCAACGVAPELDELLDGEDTSQVLDRSAVLSMASLELVVSHWVAGDPSDVGNTDYVAVEVSLENTCAASWAASQPTIRV